MTSNDELRRAFEPWLSQGGPENWDARAEAFYQAKRSYGDSLQKTVAQRLCQEGLLRPTDRLVDVGAGYGRYSLIFARHCQAVTACDVSDQMLARCRSLADEAGLHNLTTQIFDVNVDDPKTLKAPFDVAFASMCCDSCTPEGMKGFMSLASRFCIQLRYCHLEDRHLPGLYDRLGIDPAEDKHEGRDAVKVMYDWLWDGGWCPSILWVKRREEQELSLKEAMARYRLSVGAAAKAQGLPLEELIRPLARNGVVPMKSETTVALVIWPLEERFWYELDS